MAIPCQVLVVYVSHCFGDNMGISAELIDSCDLAKQSFDKKPFAIKAEGESRDYHCMVTRVLNPFKESELTIRSCLVGLKMMLVFLRTFS